jgi:hypothetical protein
MQTTRELDDVQETDVPFAALDPTDVVPMQLSQFGELLLRQVAFQSQLADALSENDSRVGIRHPAILGM